MLTNDQILEMASTFPDIAQAIHHDIVPDSVIIAFARLIQQAQREEDAVIAETASDMLQNSTFDGIAAAIRNSGGE